jgi:hypothetical protein
MGCTCGQTSDDTNHPVTVYFSCKNPTNPTLLLSFPIGRPFSDVRLVFGDPTFPPEPDTWSTVVAGFVWNPTPS